MNSIHGSRTPADPFATSGRSPWLRRQAVRLAGVLPAICALGLGGWLASCATSSAPPLQRFEYARPEMGMEFRVVLYAAGEVEAAAAATAALDRIRALNAVLSDYEDDSELVALSRSAGEGRAVRLSPELWEVLERAQALARRTDGAFDVTVGPYVSLWRRARRLGELPRADLTALARERVGFTKLQLDPGNRTALLAVPRMRLDLGGIAKGYALDAALEVLGQQGIRSALVSGGGDMVMSGPPPGRKAWRVALMSPTASGGAPTEFLAVKGRAVATSGDLFQYVEIGGVRYSHIVDPRTGVGLTDQSLVTVIAPDSTTADSLATAVSVLGPDAGGRLLESIPGVEGRIVRPLGQGLEVRSTAGFDRWLERAEDGD